MDSVITAAGRALAAGDPLAALKRVALRDDAPARALRGIAMAQLGDLVRAKALLRSGARAFDLKEAVGGARCVVAEAEIALVSRDLGWPAKALDAARVTLEEHGDRVNAAHAGYLEARRLLLIGRLDEAERMLAELDPTPFLEERAKRTRAGHATEDVVSSPLPDSLKPVPFALPPALRTAHELVTAGIAMRRLRTKAARAALARAERAAPRTYPCADGGGRKRIPCSEHTGSAPDCERRGATPPARRGRSVAGVESACGGRVPLCSA